MRNTYKILVGMPEQKRPLGSMHIDGRIPLMFKWICKGCKVMDWICVAQDSSGYGLLQKLSVKGE
jgi:hypothetical protein